MWVFYLISLPLTLGMVFFTLRYFVGPGVPRYVIFTVGYAWFCSLSFIIVVPADIWATIIHNQNWVISFFWSWSYWSTFLLTWAVVPLIQGYEDAGDFTWRERLKTSVHVNLVFYLIVGSLGLVGLIFLVMMRKSWKGGVLGFAMACSNTFGLVTGAFLLGFGLSEIPKSMWRNADWTTRQKVLSHKIAKMAVKLDDAHQALSNAIVVAQATSNQMSKRDLLRPYMDVIDNMLTDMFHEDPSFKPQGGQLGEDDMDYDTDEKTMAALRRNIRGAREQYFRFKSQYMKFVMEALELEDTIRNYERRSSTGWKFVSSLRPGRTGKLGSILDTTEFIWRCYASKQLKRLLAIVLGIMSASILLAEATLLPDVDLSLFSILIKAVGEQEMAVQVFAFVPLMYMCMCTYYSLFKIGMLMFYSLTPRQTSSVSLLMICSMVARYAPPISYNFLNLIRLKGNGKTVFEKRMGNIDDAVPFFGHGFNNIYPLFMVIYTLLVVGNFFDRVIEFFGSWKRFRLQTEADDTDGLDPSGIIILQKERSWIEQGCNVGEHVIPLARNFIDVDLESTVNNTEKTAREMHSKSILLNDIKGGPSNSKEETRQHGTSREAMNNKYAAIREHNRQASKPKPPERSTTRPPAKPSSLDEPISNSDTPTGTDNRAAITSTWQSMKMGFQTFKTNMGNKKFIPLHQTDEPTRHPSHDVTSSESLDEIFQRLKRPSSEQEHRYYHEEDDDGMETRVSGLTR